MREEDDYIRRHRDEPIEKQALSLSRREGFDAAYVLRQMEGWQRLRRKVPAWTQHDDLCYPPRIALEQCSGEAAARYKAEVVKGLFPNGAGRLVDLTGGLGVDFSFLAPLFRTAVYVERQEVLTVCARHNFPLLGLTGAEVRQADAEAFLHTMPAADLVFLDPARRDSEGRKVVRIEDCEPDVLRLLPQLREKVAYILVKLSPMLDIAAVCRSEAGAFLRAVHVFAHEGECKDILLLLEGCHAGGEAPADGPLFVCAEGAARFRFTQAEEQAAQAETVPPEEIRARSYLYEPGPAVLKGGAFRLVAVRYGLRKLHAASHLYTADHYVADFPGRRFRVLRVGGFGKQELRRFRQGVEKANLAVRNFPASVAELRRRLRLAEGGDEYWFATTTADGAHRLIACRKADEGEAFPAPEKKI